MAVVYSAEALDLVSVADLDMCERLATDLRRRDGEALVWAQSIDHHSAGGGGRVHEDRVWVVTLLAPVQDPERPVDGKCPRIKYLLFVPRCK